MSYLLHQAWANLHPELLSLIISKHVTNAAAKYVLYRSICRSWRRSLTDYSPTHPLPSSQLPFLLLPPHGIAPHEPTPRIGNVFPLPFHDPLRAPRSYSDLPQLQNTEGRICVGSSHGWLITLGRDSSVSLLNPVTADSLVLKPLSSIDNDFISFHADSFPEYHLMRNNIWHSQSSIIRRAVLSSDPAEDWNFTLLLFISDCCNCCYTSRGRRGLWDRHDHRHFLVEDVIPFIGIFAAIDRLNNLLLFDFTNGDEAFVTWYSVRQELPPGGVFLVNSDGRLLIVSTLCFLYPCQHLIPRGYINVIAFPVDDETHNGRDIQVKERDIFVHEMELRDHALFLGHGCSVSVSVRHFPMLTRDAVYFTRVYSRLERVEGDEGREVILYQGAVYENIISAHQNQPNCLMWRIRSMLGLWNGRREDPFGLLLINRIG